MLKLFSFLFIFSTLVFSSNVFNDDKIIDQKTIPKMEEMIKEVEEKLGINLYVVSKQTSNGVKIKDFEKEFAKNLKKPFVLLTLIWKEHKVDIYSSKELETLYNKDEVLHENVIPLIIKVGNKKLSPSAGLLQGLSEIAEQIAEKKQVQLTSVIGNANKMVITILKIVVWGTLAFGLFIYFKNRNKNGK